jgi:hypothetical protein
MLVVALTAGWFTVTLVAAIAWLQRKTIRMLHETVDAYQLSEHANRAAIRTQREQLDLITDELIHLARACQVITLWRRKEHVT